MIIQQQRWARANVEDRKSELQSRGIQRKKNGTIGQNGTVVPRDRKLKAAIRLMKFESQFSLTR